MISILSKPIPYADKGSLYYYYEQGHKRFVMNTLVKSQKLDDSMLSKEEGKFVKFELGRLSRVISNDDKIGYLGLTSKLTGFAFILMFVVQAALLILSEDFLKVEFVMDNFLLLVLCNLGLGVVVISTCSYLFYRSGLELLDFKHKKLTVFVQSLNSERRFGLGWELGEKGLWVKVFRENLEFINGTPDDVDSEIIEADFSEEEHHSDDGDSHHHGASPTHSPADSPSHGHGHKQDKPHSHH